MTEITVADCRYRLVARQSDGEWIAHAVRADSGRPFGIDCTGPTEEEASVRLTDWLVWQSEHAAAIDALQGAERAYHRTVASAFANPVSGPAVLQSRKESLAAVEATRVKLDAVRARKPCV